MNRAIRYVDSALAWIIFAMGALTLVTTVLFRRPLAAFDTPLVWIFVAMFNLLRVRNERAARTVTTFCIAANFSVVMLEAVRFKMWGPFALYGALLILCELALSVRTATIKN